MIKGLLPRVTLWEVVEALKSEPFAGVPKVTRGVSYLLHAFYVTP